MRATSVLLLAVLFCVPIAAGMKPVQPPKPADIAFIVDAFTTNFCIIYQFTVQIAGALASLFFVLCGLKWLSSRDDPSERQRARDTMTYVLLGLILIWVSKPIAEAVLGTTFNC